MCIEHYEHDFFNLSYLELTYIRKSRINYNYFIMKLTNTKWGVKPNLLLCYL